MSEVLFNFHKMYIKLHIAENTYNKSKCLPPLPFNTFSHRWTINNFYMINNFYIFTASKTCFSVHAGTFCCFKTDLHFKVFNHYSSN